MSLANAVGTIVMAASQTGEAAESAFETAAVAAPAIETVGTVASEASKVVTVIEESAKEASALPAEPIINIIPQIPTDALSEVMPGVAMLTEMSVPPAEASMPIPDSVSGLPAEQVSIPPSDSIEASQSGQEEPQDQPGEKKDGQEEEKKETSPKEGAELSEQEKETLAQKEEEALRLMEKLMEAHNRLQQLQQQGSPVIASEGQEERTDYKKIIEQTTLPAHIAILERRLLTVIQGLPPVKQMMYKSTIELLKMGGLAAIS